MASVPFTCCPNARHTTFDPTSLALVRYPLPAGVAVHSIPVATTAQHVLWRFSGVGGLQLSQRLECAEKRVGGCPTNIRIQDMDIVAPNLLDDRRVEVLG